MTRASRTTTLLITLPMSLLLYAPPSLAIRWPVVTSIQATGCQMNGSGPCGEYDMEGTADVLEMGPAHRESPDRTRTPAWWGIHCDRGNTHDGYTDCVWWKETHGPSKAYNCGWNAQQRDTWELDPYCSTPSTWQWAAHAGANAGGECSVFGVYAGDLVSTPWALLDATTVANSRSSYCVKPTDPIIPCAMGPIGDLDHGTVGPNTVHTATQTATISCGVRPSIEIMGGTAVDLAEGVSSQISAVMTSPTTLRVESRLTTRGGTPGRYSSSKVVVVSPE